MNTFLQGFLDNDSYFGRFMTRVGVIIAANFCFLLTMIPIVTTGAGIAALYHVMIRSMMQRDAVNPIKTFFRGFRENLKQGTISWIIFMIIMTFLYFDIRIIDISKGALESLKYLIYGIIAIVVLIFVFLYPTMAAFSDSILHLMRNGLFFALRRPVKSIVILFFNVFPLYLTYVDVQYRPLYVFLWFFFGFGGISMIGAALLLPEFKVFQPDAEDNRNETSTENIYDADEEFLDDLKKMDGL